MSWAKSASRWWWPRRARIRTWQSCGPTAPETLADYKAPDALVTVEELPLTPMMKVDPARLAVLAERGAEERRATLARSRRPGAGMLGSGSTGAADEKERA